MSVVLLSTEWESGCRLCTRMPGRLRSIDAVQGKNPCFELSADLGREVVIAMNEVIKHAEGEK